MMKSNKPRGEVKLDKSSGSSVISRTANPMRADVNQGRGPTAGNHGNTTKQGDFLSEKSNRSGYFKQLADMVTGALERRGSGMKHNRPAGDDEKALTSLKGDFGRARRGPTKGNK
jgi:hypothetical protein